MLAFMLAFMLASRLCIDYIGWSHLIPHSVVRYEIQWSSSLVTITVNGAVVQRVSGAANIPQKPLSVRDTSVFQSPPLIHFVLVVELTRPILTGCVDPSPQKKNTGGLVHPHQCPLGSVATRYLMYADVRTFR